MSTRRIRSRFDPPAESRSKLRRAKRGTAGARRALFFETLEDRRLLATINWTGNADGLWSNPNNWSGGVPSNGDTVVFDTVNLTGAMVQATTADVDDLQLSGITFQGSSAFGVNITAVSLNVAGDLTDNSAANDTISGNTLAFTAGADRRIFGAGNLTFTGPVTAAAKLGRITNEGSTSFQAGLSGTSFYVSGGTVIFDSGANVSMTGEIGVGASTTSYFNGGSAGSGGTLVIQGTATVSTATFNMGQNNGGPTQTNVVNQTGGTVTVTSNSGENAGMRLGHWGNETSTYNLSGGTLTLTDPNADIAIATDGTGIFNQTGGTVNAPGVWVNHRNAGGSAALTVSGGTMNLDARGLVVAANSATISGGTVSVSGGVGVGRYATGTLNVQGTGQLTTTGGLYLGDANGVPGTVTQTGGTVTVAGQLRVAHWPNENSTYNISGGTLNSNGGLYVGWDGTGNLNLAGSGAVNATAGTYVQRDSILRIDGSTTFNANYMSIGDYRGAGTVVHNSGSVAISGELRVGHYFTTGSYTLNGGSLTVTGTGTTAESAGVITIGVEGSGVLNQNGGTITAQGLFLDSRDATSGTDQYNLTGGTLVLTSALGISGNATTNTFQVNLGGGTVRANTTWSSSTPMTLTGTNGNVTFDTNGNNISLTGALDGAGGLSKTGPGTLTLSGTNSFAGNVAVNGGTLSAGDVADAGSNSHLGSGSAIAINGNSVLQFTGAAADAMNRTITLSGSGGANSPRIEVTNAAGDLRLVGATISGSGQTLGKIGVGALTLGAGTTATVNSLFAAGGNLTLKDDSATTAGPITVGANSYFIGGGGEGTLNVQDSATLTASHIHMGDNYGGTFQTNVVNQSGGTVTITGYNTDGSSPVPNRGGIRIGHWPNEASTYNLSGGLLNLTDATAGLLIATDGTGTFNQTGGTATAGFVKVNTRNNATPGTFTVSGGLFNLGSGGIVTDNPTLAVNLGGNGGILRATAPWSSSLPMTLSGTGAGAVSIDTNGFNVGLSGVLIGAGGLNKVGDGSLTLTNFNTYTGGTVVDGGTLWLGAGGSIGTVRGTLTVNAGATVDYTAANAFGYLSGQSVNVLNINGGTVGGANVGNHFWNSFQLNMTGGTLYLGGTLNEFHNPTVTVNSSPTTAQILPVTGSAVLRLRDSTSALFNVADGAQDVDLLVSVPITNNGTSNIAKIGAGRLAMVGATNTFNYLNVAAGPVTLGAAGSVTTLPGGVQVGNAHTSGGGSATLDIPDGSLTTAWIQLGNTPGTAITATVNQSGGSVRTTSHPAESAGVRLGHYPAATTFYNLSGGTLLVDNGYYLTCAVDGTGTFNQTGGEATATRVVVNARGGGGGNGTLTVNGGQLNVGSGGIVNDGTGPAAVNAGGSGPTIRATATFSSSLPMTLSGSGTAAATFDTNGNDITAVRRTPRRRRVEQDGRRRADPDGHQQLQGRDGGQRRDTTGQRLDRFHSGRGELSRSLPGGHATRRLAVPVEQWRRHQRSGELHAAFLGCSEV